MATLVVGSEKNLKDLRPRLFDGKVTAAVAKRAGAAIADANPHVDIDALMPGTVLAIPDLPELVPGPALADDPLHGGLRGRRATARVAQSVEQGGRGRRPSRAGAAQEGTRGARRPQVAQPCRERSRARNRGRGRAARAQAEDGAAKDRAAALDEAIAEWTAELDALRGGGR